MTVALLPVCSSAKVAIKDGYTGAHARLYLIGKSTGAGWWFASGQDFDFVNGAIPQDSSIRFTGLRQPNVFAKDCCTILS